MKNLILTIATLFSPVFVFANTPEIVNKPNIYNNIELNINELSIEDEFTCTVTLYAKLDAGGDWKFVSVGVEGSIKFESTSETCAGAVRDIKAGMAEIF